MAATGSNNHQEHLTHSVDISSFQDGPYEQAQGIRMEMDMEDNQQLQTEHHNSEGAVPGRGVDEENASLKAEIQRLQFDAEAEQRVLDDMLTELTSAREELHDVQGRLEARESECADLRVRLSTQPVGNGSVGNIPPWGFPHQGPYGTLGNAGMMVGRSLAEMQHQINDLMGNLGAKDKLLRAQGAELEDERATRMQLSQKLAAVQEQAQREAVTSSQDAAEADEHRRTIEELKEQVRFFKTNSERLGKDIRELKDQNLQLGDDLDVRQRELDDEKSTNLALKMQAGDA